MSDLLPAADGLFLGETTTPRRWDGSRLINIQPSQYPLALLLDGSRAMNGPIKFNPNLLLKDETLWGTDFLSIRNQADTEFRSIRSGAFLAYGNCEAWGYLYVYSSLIGGLDPFIFYTSDWTPVAQINRATPCMDLVKAGNIDVIDDRFIKVGKDSDGSLPAPSASYRGKIIRTEGTGGSGQDELWICEWNGSAFAWRKI